MKINKKRRERYFAIANVVIFLSGVVIILIGVLLLPDTIDFRDISINIGGELIVVSLLFILGKFLLIDRQKDLEEHIERIEDSIYSQPRPFATRDELNSRQTFSQFISQSQDLFLAGAVLRNTARSHRSLYRDMLKKGARLRFAVLDPESADVASIAAMWQVPKENIANDIRSTLDEFKILQGFAASEKSGSVEVRLLKREPSFSFALRNAQKTDGCLRGDLRAFGLDTALRPAWELRPTDEPWFQRFVQICEALWDDSESWLK